VRHDAIRTSACDCGGLAATFVWFVPSAVHARTQVGNICTVYGQKETPVIGIGLVVGLNRTGTAARVPQPCVLGVDASLSEQSG